MRITNILESLKVLCLLGLLTSVVEGNQATTELRDGWKKLSGCELVPSDSNDGDSFHVKHQGIEYVFRLYLADCPEVDISQPDRNKEQIREFETSLKKMLTVGMLAKLQTKELLSEPFTVVTKGEDAMGQSKLGRIFAFVETSKGEDLAEILLSRGYARSYGKDAEAPTLRRNLREKYDRLAQRAKRLDLGGWGTKEIKSPTSSPIKKEDLEYSLGYSEEFLLENSEEIDEVFKEEINGGKDQS